MSGKPLGKHPFEEVFSSRPVKRGRFSQDLPPRPRLLTPPFPVPVVIPSGFPQTPRTSLRARLKTRITGALPMDHTEGSPAEEPPAHAPSLG